MSQPPPPRLLFDDGSRVMMMSADENKMESAASVLGEASIYNNDQRPHTYDYETDRLVVDIQELFEESKDELRIALQFPDHLLADTANVCWELERALSAALPNTSILVFVLADTTFAPCCPDVVAAQHLQANVLIHFGHACLSAQSTQLPVLYSFGKALLDTPTCVSRLKQEQSTEASASRRCLLLYQLEYSPCIGGLEECLAERLDALVVAGQIRRPNVDPSRIARSRECCNGNSQATGDACCNTNEATGTHASEQETVDKGEPSRDQHGLERNGCACTEGDSDVLVLGGLELPGNLDWSTFTLLYIGDDSSRQYLNIILYFLSSPNPTASFWSYQPRTNFLSTELSSSFQKKLSRRFYLIQKARQCSTFGIVVANTTDAAQSQEVVQSVQSMLQQQEKASYVLHVGKITPAKLANFAELECFVLVACPEHSLLEDERQDYAKPILTPYELTVALDHAEWGQYSLNVQDFLKLHDDEVGGVDSGDVGSDQEDSDAPYFSLVTGRYESSAASSSVPKKQDAVNAVNVSDPTIPAATTTLTKYSSAASEFLKNREYQGLQVHAGETQVHAAVPGQKGIASNYKER